MRAVKFFPFLALVFGLLLAPSPGYSQDDETIPGGPQEAAPAEPALPDDLVIPEEAAAPAPTAAPAKAPKKSKKGKKSAKSSKSGKKTSGKKSSGKSSKSAKATKPRPHGLTKPLSDFELARYQYCGSDKDCMVAQNGCCDCANGGEDVAVNKERFDAFRARFDCLYVNCGDKEAVPACTSGVVSCVNHKCLYVGDGPPDERF